MNELSRSGDKTLQQIQNAGKATSADIKQFAYAGIDVYGILADYTGKTAEEVQKMTVTYDLLSNALISAADEGGRYFNSMSTQSETLNGQWSNVKRQRHAACRAYDGRTDRRDKSCDRGNE